MKKLANHPTTLSESASLTPRHLRRFHLLSSLATLVPPLPSLQQVAAAYQCFDRLTSTKCLHSAWWIRSRPFLFASKNSSSQVRRVGPGTVLWLQRR